jgi:hypothetical protein
VPYRFSCVQRSRGRYAAGLLQTRGHKRERSFNIIDSITCILPNVVAGPTPRSHRIGRRKGSIVSSVRIVTVTRNGNIILGRKFLTNPGAILSEDPPRRDSVGTRDSTHGKGTWRHHKMDRGKNGSHRSVGHF